MSKCISPPLSLQTTLYHDHRLCNLIVPTPERDRLLLYISTVSGSYTQKHYTYMNDISNFSNKTPKSHRLDI